MRLDTILESTTERSASGASVCDVDLSIWAAKVCITASGSGSTSTDTKLCNVSTAKNRAVYYQKGQHTHNLHDGCQGLTLNLTNNIISYAKTAQETTASCTRVGLAFSLKSTAEPHDESQLLPSYSDLVIQAQKPDAITQRLLLLVHHKPQSIRTTLLLNNLISVPSNSISIPSQKRQKYFFLIQLCISMKTNTSTKRTVSWDEKTMFNHQAQKTGLH